MTSKMTVEEFLSYVEEAKSKNTHKSYVYGIEKFVEYFGKDANTILAMRHEDVVSGEPIKKKRFLREIEKYHAWLLKPIHTIRGKPNKAFTINSARNMCLGIMQLFRYYEMSITLPRGSKVSRTVISTKDFVLEAQHLKEMFKVADLRGRVIVSMAKDLGWRSGDFCKLKKDELPDLEGETPILFELITEKEDVLAKSFLSQETVDLLKTYLPTLPSDNPYLFPSNRSKNLDGESVNRIVKDLASEARIKILKHRRLRFHCFRKLFLSTCANQSVDVNIAKILVGKHVEKDMLTYLPSVDLRKAFMKVQEILALTKPTRQVEMKTRELEELRKELEEQRRIMKAMTMIYGEEIQRKAIEALKKEGVSLEFEPKNPMEALRELGKAIEEKEQAEYKELIESPNNNNNNH